MGRCHTAVDRPRGIEMSKVQVLSLSHKHREILNYMVANPTEKLGDVAARHNVSQSWLSVLVHSDAFREALRKKQDEVFHPAMLTLQERLTGMAHLTLDKLGEEIDNGKLTAPQLLETSTSVLDRLGYGTKAAAPNGAPTQNNYFFEAPVNAVQRARQTFGQRVHQSEPIEDVETVDEKDRAIQPQLPSSGGNTESGTN